jgi:GT2 family glycosyltransferase
LADASTADSPAAQAMVSVIIPCNDDTHLAETLDSLASQDGPPPFEVVLVDGLGHDLASRLEPWVQQLSLRIIPSQRGRTAGAQRNIGVAASHAALLLFVDADDVVSSGYVRTMAEGLASNGIVCSRVDMSTLNPWLRSVTDRTGPITAMGFLPFAGAGTLGIRRSLFEEVRGFDTSLARYEEADLCWRIQLAGGEAPAFVPDAVLHYRRPRGALKRLHTAFSYGHAQASLYARFRHRGMPRASLRRAMVVWITFPWRLLRGSVNRSATPVVRQAAMRLGRVWGSLRHGVRYF